MLLFILCDKSGTVSNNIEILIPSDNTDGIDGWAVRTKRMRVIVECLRFVTKFIHNKHHAEVHKIDGPVALVESHIFHNDFFLINKPDDRFIINVNVAICLLDVCRFLSVIVDHKEVTDFGTTGYLKSCQSQVKRNNELFSW